jgi:hypothetical protein
MIFCPTCNPECIGGPFLAVPCALCSDPTSPRNTVKQIPAFDPAHPKGVKSIP